MDLEIIAQAFWLIIPAYIANGCAVLVGGGTPIDFKKKYKDNRRILGDGKTWRGLFLGSLLGMIGGFGLSVAAFYVNKLDPSILIVNDFKAFPLMIPIIFSICFGALMGDIIASFFKRRIGKERGQDWIPFDQLDFIAGVLFFSFLMAGFLNIIGLTEENWFFETFTIWHILFLLFVTPLFHVFGNFLFKKGKAKKTGK